MHWTVVLSIYVASDDNVTALGTASETTATNRLFHASADTLWSAAMGTWLHVGTRQPGAHYLLRTVPCNPGSSFCAWGDIPPEITQTGAFH